MNPEQRRHLADKLMDTGHIVFGAFTIGQFLGDAVVGLRARIILFAVGVLALLIAYVGSYLLLRPLGGKR